MQRNNYYHIQILVMSLIWNSWMLVKSYVTLCKPMQVCVLVNGLYQLEVTVFGYNNPTGKCRDCGDRQSCCDNFIAKNCSGFLCDSFFIYCLRAIGSTRNGCSYFGNQISSVNSDDGPLNFSQSTVLGLKNPIILQGLANAYMVISLISSSSSLCIH